MDTLAGLGFGCCLGLGPLETDCFCAACLACAAVACGRAAAACLLLLLLPAGDFVWTLLAAGLTLALGTAAAFAGAVGFAAADCFAVADAAAGFAAAAGFDAALPLSVQPAIKTVLTISCISLSPRLTPALVIWATMSLM